VAIQESASPFEYAATRECEKVLVCGGTAAQRADRRAEMARDEVIETRDLFSVLHWASRCRSVIVCGELAGISPRTVGELVRMCAPEADVSADSARSVTTAAAVPTPTSETSEAPASPSTF
jgi:hypothetical protein